MEVEQSRWQTVGVLEFDDGSGQELCWNTVGTGQFLGNNWTQKEILAAAEEGMMTPPTAGSRFRPLASPGSESSGMSSSTTNSEKREERDGEDGEMRF